MKTLKLLFVAVLLSCIAISQTNAQADVEKVPVFTVVSYEAADGTWVVNLVVVGEAIYVNTPSGNHISEFHGWIPEGTPLPKNAVRYFNGLAWYTITPSGKVNARYMIKEDK